MEALGTIGHCADKVGGVEGAMREDVEKARNINLHALGKEVVCCRNIIRIIDADSNVSSSHRCKSADKNEDRYKVGFVMPY